MLAAELARLQADLEKHAKQAAHAAKEAAEARAASERKLRSSSRLTPQKPNCATSFI